MIVVSKDGDWKAFCESSKRLYLVPDIKRALAFVANAPPMLRKTVFDWLQSDKHGDSGFGPRLAHEVESIEFEPSGIASSGECELHGYAGTLRDIALPEERDLDIIDYETNEDDRSLRLVVSIPLSLTVRIPVEVSFSVWDSIDKESISMGGRTIEAEREIDALSTITVEIRGHGTEDEQIVLEDIELDEQWFEVDLGEIDVFEREDCDW